MSAVSLTAKNVRMVGQFNTANDGTWSQTVMAGLRYWVQPVSANAFLDSMNLSGATLTGSFKLANTGLLGITLGNLASISAFSTPSSPVTYNLFAAEDTTLS